ncbi:MAG: DUF2795 domain-containing protein [Acidimicrobiia bacterium]
MEVAQAVRAAFHGTAPTRSEIVAAARDARARSEVLSILGSLPDQRFREVRDLWIELTEIPVGV